MLVGILLIVVGIVPFLLGNVNLDTIESAAAFFTVGIFVFLVGLGLRRVRKAYEASTQPSK